MDKYIISLLLFFNLLHQQYGQLLVFEEAVEILILVANTCIYVFFYMFFGLLALFIVVAVHFCKDPVILIMDPICKLL